MFLYHEVVMKIKWDSCKIHNPGPQRKESSEDDAECDGNDDTRSYTLQKVNCVSQCDKSTTLFFFLRKLSLIDPWWLLTLQSHLSSFL